MNPTFFYSGILFFMISCRILIVSFPSYGLAQLSTISVGLQYLCIFASIIYALTHSNIYNTNKYNRSLILLFVVYLIYIINYTFISPKMTPDMIQGMPSSSFDMAMSSFGIISCLLLANMIKMYINYKLFAKWSVIVIVLGLILYFYRVDYTLYSLQRTMGRANFSDLVEESSSMISSLTLNSYVGVAYVCNLFCKNEWTNKKAVNTIIFYSVTAYLVFVTLILGERGPVLFLITTTLFFYYAKGYIAIRYFFSFLFIIIILLIFGSDLISAISSFAPDIVARTQNIADDGGSGRFGSDGAVFNVAVSQILENPIFGSYHRLLSSSLKGIYPHNLILEALMTFGLLFSIPLFILMWKAVKNAYQSLKNEAQIGLFGLLFIHFSSCLMTSGTISLNNFFWVTFALTLTYQQQSNGLYKLNNKL